MGSDRKAVVDGANIAYIDKTKSGKPKVENLTAVRDTLRAMGFDLMIIVDASMRYEIDDAQQFERLVESEDVRQAPAGTDADYFVLAFAEERNAYVVSNDEFTEYRDRFPWIEKRRIPLMIVNGDVQLYGPSFGQPGASKEK